MKTLILFTLIMSTIPAHASFNRVWVGFKKPDLSAAKFLNGLNKSFFKDTIDLGKSKGLLSYQPYVTSMGANVPDELALVIYESEEKYRALRSTPEGERYSAAHWDFFVKETSKSTVSVPFTGNLAMESAYELMPGTDWQKGHTMVMIYKNYKIDLTKLATAFGKRKSEKGIRNSILLVSEKWLIEYTSVSDAGVTVRDLAPVMEKSLLLNTRLEDLKRPIGTSQGANFRF